MATIDSAQPIDAAALRAAEFPGLGAGIYLNAAAVAPLPARAHAALRAHLDRRLSPAELRETDFSDPPRRAREAAARLIGADADEIALGWNTSFGINLAALSLPLGGRSAIVASDREFPANVYPWMGVPDAKLELIPTDSLGRPDEDRIVERIEAGDVAVLAVSSVQFASGFRMDLRRLGEVCRRHGTYFVVDAIQSVGHLPIDVHALGIDILAAGGHKWLLSPFGTGFAYVRRDLIPRMEPRVVGWTALEASRDLESLLDYEWGFRADARRFEVATLPFHDFAGAAESMELLLEVGVASIERHLEHVLEPLREWLADSRSIVTISDTSAGRRSGIVAFRPEDAAETYRALEAAGVTCALREGAIRISPHLYNTREEMERVVEVLERPGGGR